MSTTKDYRHQINVRAKSSSQLELEHDSYVGQSPLAEDLELQLRDTNARLERLKRERDEAERLTQELADLNSKKSLFISTQAEITEKLTNAVTLIERELLAMRTEAQQLEQCHETFDIHLSKITKFDPESWTRENMHANLDKSLEYMEQAADEYEQAAKYFSTKQSGNIFSAQSRKGTKPQFGQSSDFFEQVKNGFAFNLPLLSVFVLALLIYLLK